MRESEQGAPNDAASSEAGRVSFERLRERTDELELLISGLSLLALLSLPGWLWEGYESLYPRMSLSVAAASVVLLPIVSAICFVMSALFLLHLGVRAHWVGLIGLKAVFPEGIRWQRLGGIGPLTLQRLQARLPSLEQGIIRADVLASTLFSLITFSALALAVLGFWLVVLFVLAGLFGNALGGTNRFINIAVAVLLLVYMGAPVVRWLLDGVLLRWVPALRAIAPLRWLVRLLGLVEGLFLPSRVLGATRLALQGHLLPRAFFGLFIAAVMLVVAGSNTLFQRGRVFDLLETQSYISGRAVAGGMRSGYYESQRIPRDRLRPAPMIPAPLIETAWLPLFLPYAALIDDPVLAQRCSRSASAELSFAFDFDAADSDAEALARESLVDADAAAAVDCIRRIWEVRLDGVPQSLDGFLPSERADLGLRGLSGWLSLNGLEAGPHRLEVIWRPRPEQDEIAEDYVPKRMRHVIPFLWSPEAAAQPAP
jgi:hypothetical protein